MRKISEGLYMLELPMDFNNPGRVINPVLIFDEKDSVLIDAGLPGQLQAIRDEIEKTGWALEKLGRIIITHQDMDHIGSLASIQRELGDSLEVLSHIDEKPYIEFEKRPIKMTPERMAQLEASQAGNGQGPIKGMIQALKSSVNRTVSDGEELALCGGITVIYTPGHTPGHISLYLKKYRTLVAGDALNVVNGELTGPNPQFTYDMKTALASLQKFLKYDVQTAVCYHGGIYGKDVNRRLAELCETSPDA